MGKRPPKNSFWEHRKGGRYRVVGFCRIEATGRDGILYCDVRSGEETPWARDLEEFLDGRFRKLEPSK